MEKLIRIGFIIVLSTLFMGQVNAQEIKPSVWEMRFSRTKVAINDTVTIWLIGKIPGHQAVYSTNFQCELGPMPSKLVFTDAGDNYFALDTARSIGDKPEYDAIFECTLRKFKEVAVIKQVIRMKNPKIEIKGHLDYQTCTDDMCLQYRVYFETAGTRVLKVENGK